MNRIRKTGENFIYGLVITAALLITTRNAKADYIIKEVRNCGPEVNTAYGELGASISLDGLTLYFGDGGPFPTRPRTSGGGDIWVTTRETLDTPWAMAKRIGTPINSSSTDSTPCISPDGLSLYFASDRPGGSGAEDLYVAIRSNPYAPWEAPVNLGERVNSSSLEIFPSISPDGLTLYFCSLRSGKGKIFVATRTSVNDLFGSAENIGPPVNSPETEEFCPYIMPDGQTLFFTAGTGGGGICFSRRTNTGQSWGQPIKLGEIVNTGGRSGTSMTADGTRMFFHGSYTKTGYGNSDLWEVEILPVVDLNNDDQMNAKDMSILTDHWHSSDPLCDVGPTPWGDGIVDFQDLKALSEYLEPGFGRIAHWKLDETEGMAAYDSVGSYHADVLGDAIWQPDAGVTAGALAFDGVDDCLAPVLVLNPTEGPFRILTWIKGGAPGQVIASQSPDDMSTGYAYLATDPIDGALITEMILPQMPLKSEVVITDDQWHEVGVEWDGHYRHLSVDGVEVAVDEVKIPALDHTGWLDIGKGKDGQTGTYWSGLMDEIRIYKKAER
jgi:hypothetical protein